MSDEKKTARPKTKQARALLDCTVEDVSYKCNALVVASAAAVDDAAKAGLVDPHPDAVAAADRPKPKEAAKG